MPKYLSGRAKRVPQDQLSEDRYQYLGLDQAEPNLSDPLVSPSVPSGAQYQLVAVPAYPGKRYWVPVGGGLVPGAITIFDEDSPVSSSSSITQLNFVGAAVTANVSVQSPSGHPGIAATVTVIPVSVGETPPNYPTPNEGELWWESDTGDLYIYYNDGDSAQWVMTNAGGRGLAGDKGQKGEVGQTGLTGSVGDKGDKGEKGQQGDVEAQGNKGQKGEIGVGQKGQKGEAGANGTDGDKGQKGEDNSTKGQKGELGIGQKGQKGEKGTSGGGATVTISDNAPGSPSAGDMWWDSDDFDLHVYYGDGDSNQWVSITSNAALKGQKGEKGEKGEKGQKGEKGEKGQKGEVGLSGNAGGKGEKGEKGQKGEGVKGQKGDKGEKGQKGEKGEKGQKGQTGATGTGTGTADKIFENDTSVECVDTGTGVVEVKVDGTEVITVDANTTTFNDDVKLTGANYDAIWNKSDNELEFRDNARLGFGFNGSGVASDLIIKHNTTVSPPASQITNRSDSQLEVIADMLELRSGTSDRSYLTANVGAATTIFHSHTKRFETTTDGVKITGGLQDKDGQLGTSGQVLSSTGTELNWVAATSGQKGDKGQKGQDGADNSTKGQKGEAGAAASKGEKGQKGEVGAQGVGGSAGTPGDKGQKGEVGTTTKGQKGEEGNISAAIPSGGIIIWSGASNAIPSGWYLCNGSNGTPDLRNRFIVGAGSGYSVGNTGGSADATLVSHSHTVNNHTHSFSSSHTHSFSASTNSQGAHVHNLLYNHGAFGGTSGAVTPRSGNTPVTPGISGRVSSAGAHTHSISGTTNSGTASGTSGGSTPGTNSQGSSATNANLPPYYALCYIMKS